MVNSPQAHKRPRLVEGTGGVQSFGGGPNGLCDIYESKVSYIVDTGLLSVSFAV